MRVCVVGAGDAGVATAGDLALRGHDVSLLELETAREGVEAIRAAGAVEVEFVDLPDRRSGWAPLRTISTEPQELLEDAEIVIVTVQSQEHGGVIRKLVPYLSDGKTVLLMPGSLGSSVRFSLAARRAGRRVRVGEAACLIYTARREAGVRVRVNGYKRGLPIAAYPSVDTPELLSIVSRIYPDVAAAPNVLATGLSNLNLVFHPPILVTSASRTESTQGGFLFYLDGATLPVLRIVEALDAERLAVGAAYGITLLPAAGTIVAWYGHQGARGSRLYDTIHSVHAYRTSRGPATLKHRYFTEDVSFGLVPMARLAATRHVPTPTALALTHLASLLLGEDLREPSQVLGEPGERGQSVLELLSQV